MEAYKRTWEDFVEDLISDGRSLNHILAVAQATRWQPHINEIEQYAEKLRKFFRKSKKSH